MHYVAELWTWIKGVEPAWVSAVASLAGVALASGLVVRWYLLRQDLRGSGGAIIALLGESEHEAFTDRKGHGQSGGIKYSSELVYFQVGTDPYLLCKRDLERLHALGYVYKKDHKYHLSRLGHLLLERHDNARLLARGVARAKRDSCLRCKGGLWFRCRCKRFWVAWPTKIRVPFPLGEWLTTRT